MQTQEAIRWIREELNKSQGLGEANAATRLLAETLFPHTSWTQIQFQKEPVTETQLRQVKKWLGEIKTGKPIQYVLGYAWFDGLKLGVTPDVLIPRPETEELVNWVDEWMEQQGVAANNYRIIDFGTGSGCIALALKNRYPKTTVFGLEVSSNALTVARKNGERLHLDVQWLQGDLMDAGITSRIPPAEVWVSNPPYVLRSEGVGMEKRVTHFEPEQALFVPDHDPILFYRRLSELARQHSHPPKALFVELHPHFADEVAAEWKRSGWKRVVVLNDIQGKKRMAGAFEMDRSS